MKVVLFLALVGAGVDANDCPTGVYADFKAACKAAYDGDPDNGVEPLKYMTAGCPCDP